MKLWYREAVLESLVNKVDFVDIEPIITPFSKFRNKLFNKFNNLKNAKYKLEDGHHWSSG